MARVTGIGGVCPKAQDPKTLIGWYVQHFDVQGLAFLAAIA